MIGAWGLFDGYTRQEVLYNFLQVRFSPRIPGNAEDRGLIALPVRFEDA